MDDKVLDNAKAKKLIARPSLPQSFEDWWKDNVHNTRFSKGKSYAQAAKLKDQLKQLFEGNG